MFFTLAILLPFFGDKLYKTIKQEKTIIQGGFTMAERTKELDREVENGIIRDVALGIVQNPKASKQDIRKAMGDKFSEIFAYSLINMLLSKSFKYAQVLRYVADMYGELWLQQASIGGQIYHVIKFFKLSEKEKWIAYDVFNNRKEFLEQEASAQIQREVEKVVTESEARCHLDFPQKRTVPNLTKSVLDRFGLGRVPQQSFIDVCRRVEAQLKLRGDEIKARRIREEEQRLVREKEWLKQRLEEEAKRKAELDAKRKADKEAGLKKAAERRVRQEERAKEIADAPSVVLTNGQKAICLDSKDIAQSLPVDKLVLIDGIVWRRTKRGFSETPFEVRQAKEDKSSVSVKMDKSLPEKLNKAWVTIDGIHRKDTFKVTVIPAGFSGTDPDVLSRFQLGQKFAFQKGDSFTVWCRTKNGATVVNQARKASKEESLIAKGEKKALETEPVPTPKVVEKGKKAKPKKNPDRPANRGAARKVIVIGSDVQPSGDLGEKLAAAAASQREATL